ncbi:hypothetical protein TNCV_1302251 [Trichonephila clavipes]|nr:hypothetical protein TNCV_1302251 [Trichonephila clavipes]
MILEAMVKALNVNLFVQWKRFQQTASAHRLLFQQSGFKSTPVLIVVSFGDKSCQKLHFDYNSYKCWKVAIKIPIEVVLASIDDRTNET